MDLRATPNLIHLTNAAAGRRSLQLDPALGHRVIAVSGELWITQAGHTEDYVLRAGDALTLDSPGMAIVSSFGPADIEVIAPNAPTVDPFPSFSVDVLERAQREAHRLRAEAMQQTFAAAAAWIRRMMRRLTSTAAAR